MPHRGTLYDGTPNDPEDPTRPFWGEAGNLPRLPDIEKERAADPTAWDVVSYDIEPGDVLLFHLRCLHGGGAVDERFSNRRSLSLRFHGDGACWGELPDDTSKLDEEHRRFSTELQGMVKRGVPGEPLRDEHFLQLC